MKNLHPKIGLDIDGVLANFNLAYHKRYPEISPNPDSWYLDPKIEERFQNMRDAGELDEFFMGIEPLTNPSEITFDPICYITSRPVSAEISHQWLLKHGFPDRKVIGLNVRQSKVDAANEMGVEIFVDDFYENFIELNNAGIHTYLFTASGNVKYDVGNMRINSLSDITLPVIQ